MNDRQAVRENDKGASRLLATGFNCILNVSRTANRSNPNRGFPSVRGGSNNPYKLGGVFVGRVCDQRQVGNHRIEFMEEFDPLSSEGKLKVGQTCSVATRVTQAIDQPLADRVGNLCKHHRSSAGVPSGGSEAWCTHRHDHIRRGSDQSTCFRIQFLIVTIRCSDLDDDVSVFCPAELSHARTKCRGERKHFRFAKSRDPSNQPLMVALLPRCQRRPCYYPGP